MKKLTLAIFGAVLALPGVVSAQTTGGGIGSGIYGLLDFARNLINQLIPFIIALTVLVFLWGIFRYVFSSDAEGRKEAQGYMIWGIIALFVMVSVWGLVNILVRTTNLDNVAPKAPGVPEPGGFIQNR
jgi:uncharacterized membrane protein YidH (DUF202 family)